MFLFFLYNTLQYQNIKILITYSTNTYNTKIQTNISSWIIYTNRNRKPGQYGEIDNAQKQENS